MSRWLFAIAVATGLLLPSAANAYLVDIYFQRSPVSVPGQPTSRMYVYNNGSRAVGAINLLVTGPNSLSLNTSISGLSLPDSSLTINPLGDGQNFLIVSNTMNGISIVNAGAQDVWLADLSGPNFLSWAQGSELAIGSYTVFDTFLRPIPNVGIFVDGFETYSYVAAEPATTSLLALGLAAFGLARRAPS